jgi:topoisomerase IV subunit B
MLSVFMREPEFQGQTKEKLASIEAARLVEAAIRDRFDHWLAGHPAQADKLLEWIVERAEERLRRRQEKETDRKTATRKLRLPGKLADCGGTATKAPNSSSSRAIRPAARPSRRATARPRPCCRLRGKILNVASAGRDKLAQNQQLSDLIQALGCGTGASTTRRPALRQDHHHDRRRRRRRPYRLAADHLLLPRDAEAGRGRPLYLAVPPLYRLSQGARSAYARDDAHKDELMRTEFKGRGKVEVAASRAWAR